VQQAFGYPVVVVWNGIKVSNHNEMELCSIAGNMKDIPEETLKTTQLQVATISETWMVSQARETPSLIAVPLMRSNQLIGALAILSPYASAFQETDRAVMETLATQVSSALERIGLFESVEQEQRRLLAVLRSAADAILVIDNEMCLTLANLQVRNCSTIQKRGGPTYFSRSRLL
jgi:GAF domain-containing protein